MNSIISNGPLIAEKKLSKGLLSSSINDLNEKNNSIDMVNYFGFQYWI